MKYIVYQDGETEVLVTFPRCIDHDKMAECLGALRFGGDHDWHRNQGKIIAAGFVTQRHICEGSSETLGIKSRGALDTELLARGGSNAR